MKILVCEGASWPRDGALRCGGPPQCGRPGLSRSRAEIALQNSAEAAKMEAARLGPATGAIPRMR